MNAITVPTSNSDAWRDRTAPRLPPKAQRKLERWRQDDADAAALRAADVEQLAELRAQKGVAKRELDELERADKAGKLFAERRVLDAQSASGFRTEQYRDVARLEAVKRRVQTAQDQIERLQTRMAHRSGNPLSACEAYLRQLPPHTELIEHDTPPAARLPNEAFAAAIERVREAITELREQARTIALAPLPASETKRRIRAEIEALAATGRPGTLAVAERAGRVRWPTLPLTGVQLQSGTIPRLQDAFALLAWMFKSELIKAMERVVDEDTDDTNALTDDDRKLRLKQIAGEILSLERAEEFFAEQCDLEGIAIGRRSDIDPRAVLGLSDDLPAPRQK